MEVNGAPVYFERSITSYYVLLDNFAYTPSPSSWTPAVPCPSG